MYSFIIWTLDSYFSRLEAEMLARVMIFGAKLIRIDGQLFQYQTEVTQRAQKKVNWIASFMPWGRVVWSSRSSSSSSRNFSIISDCDGIFSFRAVLTNGVDGVRIVDLWFIIHRQNTQGHLRFSH